MASSDQILKILIQVQSQLADLEKTKKGIEDLKGSVTKFSEVSLLLKSTLGALIPTSFVGALGAAIAAVKAFEAAEQALFDEMQRGRQIILENQQSILALQDAMIELTKLKKLPLADAIAELTHRLAVLRVEQELVNQSVAGGTEAWKKYQEQINTLNGLLSVFTDKQEAAAKAEVSEANEAAREARMAMLREQMTLLQNIRQEQQLINAAPFLGADEKQAALLSSSRKEMQNIAQAIETTQTALKGSGLDPTEYEQLEQRLQLLRFRFAQLKQDISAAGLVPGIRAELTSWANSFGTTSAQIGKTIEGTIGVALQSVNQFLVTGKFNAQALLQQLVMLGLQLVEQMIIQRVMAAINAAASAGQAAATGPIIAAAWAPAATAATIATQGSAAYQAPFAIAAALAASMGILVAHEGGPIRRRRMHGGGLAADEVPIIAQEGEIMIQRSVAQQPGMTDYLLGLNAGMFHGGGFVFGGRYHKGGGGIEPGFYGDFEGRGYVPPWEPPPPLHDPTDIPRGGPQVRIGREPEWAEHGQDPGRAQSLFNRLITFGTSPPAGNPFGSTYNPTFWVNYPGVGPVPMAVPVGGWSPEAALHHMGQDVKTKHGGGLISRFHGGGSVGGGRSGGGIHIYAFTDLRQLTKHMASKDGQKIIFDTVKGRRIDLGIS